MGRLRPRLLLAVGILVALALLGGMGTAFPDAVTLPVGRWADALQSWVVRNRASAAVFALVFRPLASLAAGSLDATVVLLTALGWPGVIVLVVTVALLAAGWRVAVVTGAALVTIGLIGRWDDAMVTLALTLVAVLASAAVGVPVGVLAGRVPRVARAVRPVLDTLQITPAYVYLIPLVLLFGIGDPAAVVATVLFAVSPLVRLTALGVRGVPRAAIEVADSSGATSMQLLRTVQFPLALPSIRIGLNQTIMMALAMAVIASLVGATGLGREVLRGLQTLNTGRALDAGIAIVLLAVVLDRVTTSAGGRGSARITGPPARRTLLAGVVAAVGVAALPAPAAFPFAGAFSLAPAAAAFDEWSRVSLYGTTSRIADVLLLGALEPLRALLVATPWWLLTLAVALLARWAVGDGTALFAVIGLAVIGAMGTWELTMDTLSQVTVATLLAVVIAVPLGVLASQSDVLARALRPLLDGMQTLPAFVYLVPVVALFNVGRVPGLIASVVYALPPAVRMTDAGIRGVDAATIEAARSQGATRAQLLRTVLLPLARPTILMGINQTTMMVLAAVIIAGLVGAGGLGLEAVIGLARGDFGRGIQAGIAIVLLGVLIDRITQGLAGRRHAHAL